MKQIPVSDPLAAAADPAMPWLTAALDPVEAITHLQSACSNFVDKNADLRAIRVTRHKPGRRCVVEYEFDAPGQRQAKFNLLGKVRAKGLDKRTPQLLE